MTELTTMLYSSKPTFEGTGLVYVITERARASNAKYGITGLLAYDGTLFAQLVEGPSDSIEQLQKNLLGDSMHKEMVTHFLGPTNGCRLYPMWRMGFLSVAAGPTLKDIRGTSDLNALRRFTEITGNLTAENGQAYPSLTSWTDTTTAAKRP